MAVPALTLGAGALMRPAEFFATDPPRRAAATPLDDPSGQPAYARTRSGVPPTASPSPPAAGRGAPEPRATPDRTATPSSRRAPRSAPSPAAPSPAAPPRAAASAARAADGVEEQVVALVNRERSANGCGAVTLQPQLAEAARLHSADQAATGTMSHTGSDGSSPWDRAERAGYARAIGENVAAGYRSADAVMAGWMDSPGHRANILNCDARAIGVGRAAADDGTPYWTQMFGSAL
ncbi:CAP domain-containing protein [Micromonospora pattaloongensis]|uniref:CAP domain-containing protein n=1 Tax=Micromonospora pattaloongensis TaxID=405436 RepID=UPI000B81B222|nr:CAP domain-containing protein [Micromonospora pattaloongensis]